MRRETMNKCFGVMPKPRNVIEPVNKKTKIIAFPNSLNGHMKYGCIESTIENAIRNIKNLFLFIALSMFDKVELSENSLPYFHHSF